MRRILPATDSLYRPGDAHPFEGLQTELVRGITEERPQVAIEVLRDIAENLLQSARLGENVEVALNACDRRIAGGVVGIDPVVKGSELYRGPGSILLGELAVSTLVTLFVIPSLLACVILFERSRKDETV